MIADLPGEQVSNAIDCVAAEVLAEAGVVRPPVDVFSVAERLGLAVFRDVRTEVRARFVRLAGAQPTIFLANEPRAERRQWAVAHEIGEHCTHRVFENLGLEPVGAPPGAREEIANQIAGRLLLPREWFVTVGANVDWDLFELKAKFATASHEMIARRMLAMPLPVIITLWDQGKLQWRRSNAMHRPAALTAVEHDTWQAAHRLTHPARCDGSELPEGVEDVRAWPIHEPQWRREIVRTQLSECW